MEEFKKIYNVVWEVLKCGIEVIKFGEIVKSIDDVIRNYIIDCGYG